MSYIFFLKKEIQTKEHLRKYFAYLSKGEFRSIAHLLIHTFVTDEELMTQDYASFIKQRFNEYSLDQFPKIIETVMGFDLMNEKQSLIDSLMQLQLTDHEKLQLISMFYNFERSIDEICNEINSVIKIMKLKLEEYQTQLFKQHWTKFIQEGSFDTLIQHYGLKYIQDENHVLTIYPRIVFPFSFSLLDLKQFPTYTFVRSGIYVAVDLELLSKRGDLRDNMLEVLKVISDNSKFDILLFVKDKAAYCQEIANHLNLKTSTISYHMEALINIGLIIVEKQNNRIYYRLNDKNMKEFMERFKELFL